MITSNGHGDSIRKKLKSLAFYPNGKPRGWVRALVGFDKQRNANGLFRFIAVDLSGRPRPAFAPWVDRLFKMRTPEHLANWIAERDEIVEKAYLSGATTLTILASPHTQFIARLLSSCLEGSRLSVEVCSEFTQDVSDLYIVIAPQYFEVLPPLEKCVFFQVEQSVTNRWFTNEYLDLLQSGLGILDYSLRNLEFMREKNIPLKSMYYMPLSALAPKRGKRRKSIDVLFYGDASFGRRMDYINRLKKSFKVEVITNAFGEEIREKIRSARVVVNIHAYENALLETTRLCEVISEGTSIVSETAVDQEAHRQFDNSVKFVPAGDLEAMVSAVSAELNNNTHTTLDAEAFQYSKFMLLRSLLGLGVLNPKEFFNLTESFTLPSGHLILALPEEPLRYKWCQEHRLEGYEIFPGLRSQPSWKGCGLSYWYMAKKAIGAGCEELRIYEDDAEFPSSFSNSMQIVDSYLRENSGSWDVFSGMISDISPTAKISKVTDYRKLRFVHLDQMVGLVFGIYRSPALEKLANWDWNVKEKRTGAIDRYLEQDKRLRIVTTDPYLCHHSSDFHSSIWDSHNTDSEGMIASSAKRLSRLVQAFQKTKLDID